MARYLVLRSGLAGVRAGVTWLQLGKSATQNSDISAGNPVTWNQKQGNITWDNASAWTLAAGRKYLITVNLGASFSGSGGSAEFGVYNITTAAFMHASYYGNLITILPPTNTGHLNKGAEGTSFVYTPAQNEQMEVRIISATNMTGVYSSALGSSLNIAEV